MVSNNRAAPAVRIFLCRPRQNSEMISNMLAYVTNDYVRELKRQRRQRQRKRNLKISMWEMVTTL